MYANYHNFALRQEVHTIATLSKNALKSDLLKAIGKLYHTRDAVEEIA
jgi:hypothetical protein